MELSLLSADVSIRGEEDGERVSLARHGGTEERSAASVILRESRGGEGRRKGRREGRREGGRDKDRRRAERGREGGRAQVNSPKLC